MCHQQNNKLIFSNSELGPKTVDVIRVQDLEQQVNNIYVTLQLKMSVSSGSSTISVFNKL